MKKKVLLSSIVTIALCLCLIVGSTFALFTSKSSMNIAVTAGEVKVEAVIDTFQIYSVQPTEGGSIEDEFGGTYEYVECTDTLADGTTKVFANGGTAAFENRTLTLDKITPGDKVSFNIASANKSNVAIQYRYVIECKNGSEKLMSTMLLSVGQHEEQVDENTTVMVPNTAYPAVKSYTSPWVTLEANQDDITDVPVVLEFPVTVGNDYQNEKLEINVYVEAYQSNADLDNTNTEAVVVFLDGSHKLLGAANDDITINEGQNVGINMDGATVNGAVTNNGTLDLSNGTVNGAVTNNGEMNLSNGTVNGAVISNGDMTMTDTTVNVDFAGFQNIGGTATITNVTMNAGTKDDYSNITRGPGAETVYNNVDLNSAGGGVAAADGASVIFNSGELDINTTSTSGRYLFYAEGQGSTITINGGNFDFNKTQNQKRAYIYAGEGTTVYVNGGTFGKASTRSGYTDGILGTGNVVITGGTFGFDPTKWMAAGYQAIKNGAQWYVVPETVDSVATSAEQVKAALDNGEDNIVVMNVTFTENNFNGRYYKDRTIEFVNCTFQANMNYMYINNATFTNCVFDCGSENAAVHYDELFGELVFNDCTFISGKIQIGANKEVTGTVAFNNCTFAETATTSIWAERGIRVYSPATFTNCEFNNRVVLAGSSDLAVTFNTCTMNGGEPVYYVDNTDGIIRGGNIPTVTVNN